MKQKKRLVFLTYPCFYSSIVLNSILSSSDIEVVAIVSSTRNLRVNENSLVSAFKRIIHSGLHYSCYLWFITSAYGIVSQWSRFDSVHKLASKNKIPHYKTCNINSDEMKASIREINPDIILCAHFNQRVAPKIYSLAKNSALNIHPSLLPDLKGVDPAFYAMLERYKKTGVSLHHLDEEFDTGSVTSNQMCDIQSTDSLFSLNCKLFQAGGDLLMSYLQKNNGYIETTTRSRYDSWPCASKVNEFRQTNKLISLQNIKWMFSHETHR